MPASMISAPVGSSPKVIGSRIEIVAMGPTPGSTPISVPTRQPAKQSAMFFSVSATPKPSERWESVSIIAQIPRSQGASGIGRLSAYLNRRMQPADMASAKITSSLSLRSSAARPEKKIRSGPATSRPSAGT